MPVVNIQIPQSSGKIRISFCLSWKCQVRCSAPVQVLHVSEPRFFLLLSWYMRPSSHGHLIANIGCFNSRHYTYIPACREKKGKILRRDVWKCLEATSQKCAQHFRHAHGLQFSLEWPKTTGQVKKGLVFILWPVNLGNSLIKGMNRYWVAINRLCHNQFPSICTYIN